MTYLEWLAGQLPWLCLKKLKPFLKKETSQALSMKELIDLSNEVFMTIV